MHKDNPLCVQYNNQKWKELRHTTPLNKFNSVSKTQIKFNVDSFMPDNHTYGSTFCTLSLSISKFCMYYPWIR